MSHQLASHVGFLLLSLQTSSQDLPMPCSPLQPLPYTFTPPLTEAISKSGLRRNTCPASFVRLLKRKVKLAMWVTLFRLLPPFAAGGITFLPRGALLLACAMTTCDLYYKARGQNVHRIHSLNCILMLTPIPKEATILYIIWERYSCSDLQVHVLNRFYFDTHYLDTI